jgi:hypothetical protein
MFEEMFGTETAFGIRYVTGDNEVFEAAELDEYQAKHNCVLADVSSEFPDGSMVNCTNYAVQIGKKFPDSTIIYGFKNEDNPDCEIAQQRFHPGGHDFAVVEDRWLIDPWAKQVRCAYDRVAYDLMDPRDFAIVRARYGRRDNWKIMNYKPEDFKGNK